MRGFRSARHLKSGSGALLTIATALLLAAFNSCPGKMHSGIATGPKAEALLSPARRQILAGLKKQSATPVNIAVDTRSNAVVYLGMSYPTGVNPGSAGFAEKANSTLTYLLPLLDLGLNRTEIVPDNEPCDASVLTYNRTVSGMSVLGSTITMQFSSSGNLTGVVNAVASVSSQIKGATKPPSNPVGVRSLAATSTGGTPTVGTPGIPGGSLPGNNYGALVPVISKAGGYLQQVTVNGYAQSTPEGVTTVGANLVSATGTTVGTITVTQASPGKLQPLYHMQDETGIPDFITYNPVGGVTVESIPGGDNAVEIVYRFLTEHPSLFHTGSPRCQFSPIDIGAPAGLSGVQFVRMEQRYVGLPVFGAQLVFEIHDQNKMISVAGHVLPNINLDIAPQINANTASGNARNALLDALAKSPDLPQAYVDAVTRSTQTAVAKAQLGIFPGTIVPNQKLDDRLAYKVEFSDFVYFIDAQSGAPLYSYSTAPSETILFDAKGKSDSSTNGYVEAVVGTVPTGAIALNTDLAGGMPVTLKAVDSDYALLGWDKGSDNHEADWVANTNVKVAGGCPNSEYVASVNETFFCLGMGVLPDVVGHENTHGVINYSSGLIYRDEPGAMNESFADLFGNLFFHDPPITGAPSSWLVAESPTGAGGPGLVFGAVRDMAKPGTFGVALKSGALTVGCRPGVPGLVCDPGTYGGYVARNTPGSGCNLLPTSCDNGFVHTNSGILNRAHAMMTGLPGGTTPLPPFPGFSGGDPTKDTMARNKLKYIAYLVMVFRLTPWARMMDASFLEQDAANILVSRGATDVDSDTYTQSDADQVPLAFGLVGLTPSLSTGWAEPAVGFAGTDTYSPSNPGGCAITNVTANLDTPSGVLQADLSPATAIPLAVAWPGPPLSGGIPVAAIAFFPPPPGPGPIGATTGTYSISWANIFGHKPPYNTNIVTAPPPAGANDCVTPVGSTPVVRYTPVAEHSEIAIGGSGTDTAGNATSAMSAACTLTSTEIQMVAKDGTLMEGPAASVRHVYSTNMFFSITSGATFTGATPTGPPNLSASVHWWFDSGVAIRYQLVYNISQPNDGTNCTP